MLEYLYLLTFFSWIPLAVMARAQRRRPAAARVLWTLSCVTFVLCGYLLYLEFIWSKTVIAPIRVDLLLLIPLGTGGFICVGIWGLRRAGALTKAASVLLLLLSLPTLVVFMQGMWRSSQSLVRLNARPALIFEAQFRNARNFENFFGTLDSSRDPRAGHFRAEDPNGVATRVIINDRGHFWLMFRCPPSVECVYSETELGAANFPATFKTQREFGPAVEIVVSAWTPDRLTLSFQAGTQTFVRSPVPVGQAPTAPERVTFVGTFAQTRIDRDYVYLVQVWMWESADRWLAYYVRRIAMCGSISDFVFPTAFAGTPISDRLSFKSVDGAQGLESFEIGRPAADADRVDGQIFYRGQPLEPLKLTRRSILRAPLYDLAPRVAFDATADWLKTVSMGQSLSWKAECEERTR
jgi:hypothetical protein